MTMEKENKDRFQLNKGSKRSFDTSKKKRSFDITKDKDEAVAVPVEQPQNSKKKWWVWILLLLLVGGIVASVLTKNANPSVDDVDDNIESTSPEVDPQVESVVDTTPDSQSEQVVDSKSDNQSESVADSKPDNQSESVADSKPEQQAEQDKSATPVEKPETSSPSNGLTQKQVEQRAMDVIRGDYGNGQERKNRLGSEYDRVQRAVNKIYRDMNY